MSSLTSFSGSQRSPAYGASKAAVRHLGEGLRDSPGRSGIIISVICPVSFGPRSNAGIRPQMPFR
jgi:short-subunit dehydrogenase